MSIFSGWSHWLWVLQRYFTWQNPGLHVHVHVGAGSVISHRLKCYTMRACFMSTVSSTYMYTVSQHSYKARCEAGFYIYSIMNYRYSIFFFYHSALYTRWRQLYQRFINGQWRSVISFYFGQFSWCLSIQPR